MLSPDKMTIAELALYIDQADNLTPEIEEALIKDTRIGAATLLERHRKRQERRANETARLEKMLAYEKQLWEKGFKAIAGIDEAGRGPLAGPVVAAAVVFSPGTLIDNLNDSKQLSAARRGSLYEEIILNAKAYGIGSASREEIDHLNIHQATFLAMKRALAKLPDEPDFILVDGFTMPESPWRQKAIKSGDALSLSIAAASVLAKVTRDTMMLKLHEEYPQYGFNRNKGYGTADHCAALNKYGPCPAHRVSFRLKFDD
ncbi:MAG: ribonuclease HII [Firmicutes bacterium]|nr:ribonuclease HII [Bacillota bacterium]